MNDEELKSQIIKEFKKFPDEKLHSYDLANKLEASPKRVSELCDDLAFVEEKLVAGKVLSLSKPVNAVYWLNKEESKESREFKDQDSTPEPEIPSDSLIDTREQEDSEDQNTKTSPPPPRVNEKQRKANEQAIRDYVRTHNLQNHKALSTCAACHKEKDNIVYKQANEGDKFLIYPLCRSCVHGSVEYLTPVNIKKLPTHHTKNVSSAGARNRKNRLLKRYSKILPDYPCFNCGNASEVMKILDLDKWYKVVPLCRSCLMKLSYSSDSDAYPEPIDLFSELGLHLSSELKESPKDKGDIFAHIREQTQGNIKCHCPKTIAEAKAAGTPFTVNKLWGTGYYITCPECKEFIWEEIEEGTAILI